MRSKIVFCGPSGAGKTTIIASIFGRGLYLPAKPTLVLNYTLSQKDNVECWEVSGLSEYNNVFFKHSECCVYVFDMSSQASLEGAKKWIALTRNVKAFKILVGNIKNDRPTVKVEDCGDVDLFISVSKEHYGILKDAILQNVSKMEQVPLTSDGWRDRIYHVFSRAMSLISR